MLIPDGGFKGNLGLSQLGREQQMEEPVGDDPYLAIETRHLHQVNATPQEPCDQSRDLDAENLRDGGTMSKRAERSETFEPEFRPLAAAHGGGNVDGGGPGLATGVLCRPRNRCARHGLAGAASTQP